MNEMELLVRFRDEVPANMAPASAETALLDAIRGGKPPAVARWKGFAIRGLPAFGRPGRPWRTSRLAMAGGLSLTVVAATLATLVIQNGGSPAHPGLSVRELAYRTAAVAAAQPDVPPGQWVYWREKVAGGNPAGVFQVWTTADGRKAAYVYRGKVHIIRPPRAPLMKHGKVVLRHGRPVMKAAAEFIGQPAVFVLPHGQGVSYGSGSGAVPVSYADLGSLPHTPKALDRRLGRLQLPGWGPAGFREFEVIKELLTTYVMPPGLTAELYRALGDIPGVTADDHAVDVAGRPGVGFMISIPASEGGGTDEIIINPRTFHQMGTELLATAPAGARGKVLSGTAILRKVLVSGPGVLP